MITKLKESGEKYGAKWTIEFTTENHNEYNSPRLITFTTPGGLVLRKEYKYSTPLWRYIKEYTRLDKQIAKLLTYGKNIIVDACDGSIGGEFAKSFPFTPKEKPGIYYLWHKGFNLFVEFDMSQVYRIDGTTIYLNGVNEFGIVPTN